MSDHTEYSSLPAHTAETLYESGPEVTWSLPGADDQKCEGAVFHSPRPLFVKSTPLVLSEWWPEDWFIGGRPDAWLCGTCRDNLSILLQMLHHTDGELRWEVRREFGNDLRALAMKGWAWFAEHRSQATPTEGA